MNESSISHIITQLRVLNAACKETRTKDQWYLLEKTHSMLAYSDFEDERNADKLFKKIDPGQEVCIKPPYMPAEEVLELGDEEKRPFRSPLEASLISQ